MSLAIPVTARMLAGAWVESSRQKACRLVNHCEVRPRSTGRFGSWLRRDRGVAVETGWRRKTPLAITPITSGILVGGVDGTRTRGLSRDRAAF